MNPGFCNHDIVIKQIADELGIKPEDVHRTIDTFFASVKQQMKYPNVISIPKLGTLKPDMRVYRGVLKRQQLLKTNK